MATAPTVKARPAHSQPVAETPIASNKMNPASAAPNAAPSVFAPYSVASGPKSRPPPRSKWRVRAGSVPPIRIVGGSSSTAAIAAATANPAGPGPAARTGERMRSLP